MEKVLKYIEDHRDEYIALLQKLCRQPSVSPTGEGIPEMVELVRETLRSIGAKAVEFPTEGNPILYAELPGKSPRIFGFYDHYDVQPVDPLDQWIDDPYSAVIRDGAVYARGAVDNKNGIAAKVCAVDAWQKVYGELPCGVKFFIEGEEETGSPHLAQFAQEHRDLLQCDGFHWESGWKDPGCPPRIEFGVKGLLYIEMRVRTASVDAHSGEAAIVPNPAWRLVQALATIKDGNDKILIDGFYDKVKPLSQADLDILDEDPFDEEMFKAAHGIQSFVNDLTGKELLIKHYYTPTANIAGICAGYTGEGSKTVIPAEAFVKMDFRLVPDQDPEEILQLLRAHLDRHGFTDIELICHSGARAFRSDPDSIYGRAVVSALKKLFGDAIVHHTLTGTSPMPVFCAADNIPVASFGGTSTGSNIHAPNEYIYVDSFVDEIKMIAAVMQEIAAFSPEAASEK